MRCAQCRGQIERPSAICPHCGATLTGLDKLRTKLNSPGQGITPLPPRPGQKQGQSGINNQAGDLFARARDFVLRDTKTTVMTGMVAGAILGEIIGFGWFIGTLIGGFATYKYLEKK